jgi:hypothetical protein
MTSTPFRLRRIGAATLATLSLTLLTAVAATAAPLATPKPAGVKQAAKPEATMKPPVIVKGEEDSTLTLRGGQEGTVFRSLTIEGEDRIHFEVARPELRLELDPEQAPGLEWGTARDVLDRTKPDGMIDVLAVSKTSASPYTAHPWLSHFASGAVARFHPAVEGAERWKLTIASAKGEPVASFEGRGNPPQEIAWDGRSTTGATVVPGVTYSYAFEATDRAGNRRRYVGEGFKVAAYRVSSGTSCQLVFTGSEIESPPRGVVANRGAGEPIAPVLIEAASWINQLPGSTRPVNVVVTSRTADDASRTSRLVGSALTTLLLGDDARVRTTIVLQPDAPEGGAVAIECGSGAATPPKSARR